MKKFLFLICIAAIVSACAAETQKNAWVKVEGNKFVDPQGNELVFGDFASLIRQS